MMKVFNVYFCNPLERNFICLPSATEENKFVSLAALLNSMTSIEDNQRYSICVDGSGINNYDPRDVGVLFTYHLASQVDAVAKKVKEVIGESQEQVTLNIFGYTRGGAAALLLCKKLKTIFNDWLEINVVCIDPLAGNLLASVNVDAFFKCNATLSYQVSDLSDSDNLNRMLILFTPQFTDNFLIGESAHYPILPTYPASCATEVDVTPGLNFAMDLTKKAAAFVVDKDKMITPVNNESIIVFQRVVEFMQENGTVFQMKDYQLDKSLAGAFNADENYTDFLRSIYADLCISKKFIEGENEKRSMQMGNEIYITKNKQYLNAYHQKLLGVDVCDTESILRIKEKNPVVAKNELSPDHDAVSQSYA